MVRMSNLCKDTMIKEFGFVNSELLQIENFMNKQNNKTAKDILYSLIEDKKLNDKQKIVISYIVGNSVGHISGGPTPTIRKTDISSDMPYFGG